MVAATACRTARRANTLPSCAHFTLRRPGPSQFAGATTELTTAEPPPHGAFPAHSTII